MSNRSVTGVVDKKRLVLSVSLAVGMSAGAAFGGVYDDALFWFRGGKTSGTAVAGSLFDEMHADDPSHANHQAVFTGYEDCRTIEPESVKFPSGRDEAQTVNVLRLRTKRVTNGATTSMWQCGASADFLYKKITDAYTVVARVRRDMGDSSTASAWLTKFGYAGSWGGDLFGFTGDDAATNKYPIIYSGGKTSAGKDALKTLSFTELRLPPTDVWFDIALTISGNSVTVGLASDKSRFGNHVVRFAQKSLSDSSWTRNGFGLSGGTAWKFFCENPDAAETTVDKAKKAAFVGSVQQIAVWNRVLSQEEIREAWGYPNASLLKVGLENDASNEFAANAAPTRQTINPYTGWSIVSPRLKSDAVWEIPFTVGPSDRGFPQILSFLAKSDSAAGTLSVSMNGTFVGSEVVMPGKRAVWYVPGKLIAQGANSLTLTRTDSGANDVIVDAFELGGSFQVGYDGVDWGNLGGEAYINTATSISSRDVARQHWPQALNVNDWTKDRTLSFWVPPYVATQYPMSFGIYTRMVDLAAQNDAHLDVLVNDVKRSVQYVSGGKTVTADCIGKSATMCRYEVPFAAGELKPGWNKIELKGYKVNTVSDNRGYYLVNSYRMILTHDRKKGIMIVVR